MDTRTDYKRNADSSAPVSATQRQRVTSSVSAAAATPRCSALMLQTHANAARCGSVVVTAAAAIDHDVRTTPSRWAVIGRRARGGDRERALVVVASRPSSRGGSSYVPASGKSRRIVRPVGSVRYGGQMGPHRGLISNHHYHPSDGRKTAVDARCVRLCINGREPRRR
jgi:hypothetical protein